MKSQPQTAMGEAINLQYEDYLGLILYMDEEQYFHSDAPDGAPDVTAPFTNSSNVLYTRCGKYRKHWLEKFESARRRGGGCVGGSPVIDEFLYNPATVVNFGKSDCMGIVATDDFGPIVDLTSQIDIPAKQASVCFCPDLGALGIDLRSEGSPFSSLRNVFDAPLVTPLDEKLDKENEIVDSIEHPFIRMRPLIVTTFFKLSGIASIGPGLTIQAATLHRLCRCVEDTIDELHKKNLSKYEGVFSRDDLNSFKCVVLDPQGWADFATVMFCTNYSVASAVVMAIRALTFKDLFDMEKNGKYGRIVEDEIERIGVQASIVDAYNDLVKDPNDDEAKEELNGNHLFCSTYTNLGVSKNTFMSYEENEQHLNGSVFSDPSFSIFPGHMGAVSDGLERIERIERAADVNHEYVKWLAIGERDCSRRSIRGIQKQISVYELIKETRHIVTKFGNGEADGEVKKSAHYGVIKMVTDLFIPTPMVSSNGFATAGISVQTVLKNIIDHTFSSRLAEASLSLKGVKGANLLLCVPTPLSSRFRYLYAEFAGHLRDPFMFENVLDLVPLFSAFHYLMTVELPKQVVEVSKETDAAVSGYQTLLNDDDVETLVKISKLMESAMSSRTKVGFRQAESWRAALDIRNSANRLVNAADAPLGEAFRFLNRVLECDLFVHNERGCEPSARRRVGGASMVCDSPRTGAQRLHVGKEDSVYIAAVDLNIAHLTRPSELYVHYHEVAHLISDHVNMNRCRHHTDRDRICNRMDCARHRVPHPNETELIEKRERVEEIFTEMLVYYYVFGRERSNYLRHYLSCYSLDPISACRKKTDSLMRVAEVLIRGFLAVDPVTYSKSRTLYSDKRNDHLTEEELINATRRFLKMVDHSKKYLIDYDRLMENEGAYDYVVMQFQKVFIESWVQVGCIWKDVRSIVESTTDKKDSVTRKKYLRPFIEKKIKSYQPILDFREGILTSGQNTITDDECRGMAVREMLRFNIENQVGDMSEPDDIVVCLERNKDSGEYDFQTNAPRKWSKVLLDRYLNSMIFSDHQERRQHLGRTIATLKTFWNVSALSRGEQLMELIKMTDDDERKAEEGTA